MNARIVPALLLLVAGGLPAIANDGAPPPPVQPRALESTESVRPPEAPQTKDTVESATFSAKDVAFLQKTAQNGATTLRLAELALARTDSERVRQLGLTIQRDQPPTQVELQRLAQVAGVKLTPPEPTRQAAILERFGKLTDAEIEQAFIEEVIALHKSNMADFEEISASAGNSDVKAFARRLLPGLQDLVAQSEALYREAVIAGSLASSRGR